MKVLAALLLVELLFHAYAVFSAKRRDEAASAPVPAAADRVVTP